MTDKELKEILKDIEPFKPYDFGPTIEIVNLANKDLTDSYLKIIYDQYYNLYFHNLLKYGECDEYRFSDEMSDGRHLIIEFSITANEKIHKICIYKIELN